MKLETEFYKLPLKFDAQKLAQEVAQFTEDEWQPHPQGFAGNSALILVSLNGNERDDSLKGVMQPTKYLQRCPYLRQVLASLGTVVGRTRLMRLSGQEQVTMHTDVNYYWQQRVRVHVPIVTFPEVQFICNDRIVNMAEGETWIFDTALMHNVINPTPKTRIHLVSDTVGSAHFWDLVDKAETPFLPNPNAISPQFIPYNPEINAQFPTESINAPVIMSPWEQEHLLTYFWNEVKSVPNNSTQKMKELSHFLKQFQRDWLYLWAQYGDNLAGLSDYQKLIDRLQTQLNNWDDQDLKITTGVGIKPTLHHWIITPSLNPDLAVSPSEPIIEKPVVFSTVKEEKSIQLPQFDRPIFIVAAPRSGSTFLFETLMRSPSVHSINGESHHIFEQFNSLNPVYRNYDSNRLTEKDVTPEIAQKIKESFYEQLVDYKNQSIDPSLSTIRLLEKTPKNALRIPFLKAIFPDALFIYLYREAHENISSVIEAWRSGRFVTYRNLPDWESEPWSLLLTPNWRTLNRKPLGSIAAAQWQITHQYILDDLAQLPPETCCSITYRDLVNNPQKEIERLCQFANISWTENLENNNLPLSRYTVTPPDPNKWRKNADLIEPILPFLQPTVDRAEAVVEKLKNTVIPIPDPSEFPNEEHTLSPRLTITVDRTFADILAELKLSLIATSLTSEKLISLSSHQQQTHAHYRPYKHPAGTAVDYGKISVATAYQICHLWNIPIVAQKLEPLGQYDACYLFRKGHITGDLEIQDMAYAQGQLWLVSSRFSSLCTLDQANSFIPQWRPPFIQGITPDDRCHLNGVAIVNNQPKYLTALAESNSPQGWRILQGAGGIVIDKDTNQIICRGLSVPNNPRWYRNKLWVLESGQARLITINPQTGKITPIATLPGFPRGLDFAGNYAFIGVSPVRGYSPLPLAEKAVIDASSICIVNISTGQVEATVKFDSEVKDIHSLNVLPNTRYPELTDLHDFLIIKSYILPDEALRDVPQSLRVSGKFN